MSTVRKAKDLGNRQEDQGFKTILHFTWNSMPVLTIEDPVSRIKFATNLNSVPFSQ